MNVLAAADAGPSALLQRVGLRRSRGLKRREEAEEHARGQRRDRGEGQHPAVEPRQRERREPGRHQPLEHRHAGGREHEAKRAAKVENTIPSTSN